MTGLKKKLIIAGALFVAVAILFAVYIIFFSKGDDAVEKKAEKVFIVPELSESQVEKIEVVNELDSYTLYRDSSGAWVISGIENYDIVEGMFSQLRVNATYLRARQLVKNADTDKPEKYGIDDIAPKNYFTVYHDGESYTIIIGDKAPDDNGYYVRLKGDDRIYIVDTGVENAILKARRDYISPSFASDIDTNEQYTLEYASILHDGIQFMRIDKSSDTLTYGNTSTHRLTFPAYNYAVNLTNFQTFLEELTSLTGNATLKYGEEINDEVLKSFGFMNELGETVSKYQLDFKFPGRETRLYINENENGGYNVYSPKKKIIATAARENFDFLGWELISFVSSEIFMLDINTVDTFAYTSNKAVGSFKISGEGDSLQVTFAGRNISVDGFREVYRDLMYVIITGYGEMNEDGNELLKLNITTRSGETLEYRFISTSAVNCYYTLNGFGQFYVSRDKVMALIDALAEIK